MQNPDVESADPATWAIVEAFKTANPDVTVTVSGEAVAEHLQKLSVAAQSNTLPDVFWIYKANAEQLFEGEMLMDLRPALEKGDILKTLPENTVENFSSGDSIYGVPYQGLLTGLWYNEQILSDNGLEVPVTFEDLLEVARTLSAAGITTISNGANQSAFSVWSFLVYLERFGYSEKIGAILAGEESYANPDFLAMYEHIAELREAGAFASNVSTQTYQQAVDQFLRGEAAMLDSGVWASSAIDGSEIAGKVGFWRGPTFEDGVGDQDIIMNVASAPLAVSAAVGQDDVKLDAVERFLAFYFSDAAQQILVDNGQPPVTTYVPDVDAETQGALKAALDAVAEPGVTSPLTQPDLVVETTVANAMYDSIYGVVQDQLSPQQAVDLVQSAIDAQ